MTKEQTIKIIQVLRELSRGNIESKIVGICYHLRREPLLKDVCINKLLQKYVVHWKHFSGDNFFPVPSPNKEESAKECYFQITGNMSMWEGKYGALRKNLCKYIAKQLELTLNERKKDMETKSLQSQRQKVKEYLEQKNSITPLEALNMFHSFRLSDIIFRLRKQGMNITTKIIKNGKSGYAQYSLKESK